MKRMKWPAVSLVLLSQTFLSGATLNGSLIGEYTVKATSEFGVDIFKKEEKIMSANPSFLKAKRLEEENIKKFGKGRPNLAFYEKVIPLLCESGKESGSALPYYIAIEISEHLWLMKNSRINDLCINDAAKSLYKKRYCEGYVYYGGLLGQRHQYTEAISVLSEGVKNCKISYPLQRIKKKLFLYQYYNKKESNEN